MTIYYFNGSSGLDSNDGLTELTPKKNIGDGLDVLTSCTLRVRRGTRTQLLKSIYPTGNFVVEPYGDGTQRAELEFTGLFGIAHVSDGGSVTYKPGMYFIGQSVAGPTCCSAPRAAMYIDDVWMSGFWNGAKGGRDGGYIKNSRIWGSLNNGITIGDSLYPKPNNFNVTGNWIDATIAGNDGITYHDGTGTGTGGLIADNIVYGGVENCIDVVDGFSDIEVTNNKCYGGGQTGIIIAASNCKVHRNFITGSGQAGMQHHTNAANNYFYGNVVYDCGVAASNANGFVSASASGLFYLYNNALIAGPNSKVSRMLAFFTVGSSGHIVNNLVDASRASVARYVDIGNTDLELFLFQNNLYHGAASSSPFAINSGSSKTFAQWNALAALGGGLQDQGSLIADPKLLKSLHPDSASPCIGAGRVLNYRGATYDGRPFNTPPSIGAHEPRQAQARSQVFTRAHR